MIDPKLIRESPDTVRRDLEKRNAQDLLDMLESAIATDVEWRRLSEEINRLRQQRNEMTRKIAEVKKSKGNADELLAKASAIPEQIDAGTKRIEELKEKLHHGLMRLPNILHESVPVGASSEDNVKIRTWGEPKVPSFELRAHGELAEALGGADFDRARKAAGAGFVYLLGDVALLDQALLRYAIEFLVGRGYTLVEPPLMLHRGAYEGVVDLSDFESVMYKVENEDLYLIATSEHPMGAMFMDEIIDEDRLPIKLAGISPCFRREIGAHGVDTKGLFRMHQFNKIEQFIFCRPEESWQMHEELIANAEGLFKGLGIPYQVVNVCTGDIGTVAAKKYDIEAWSPRQQKYTEVVSCSNCTDYQARRLHIRCGKVGAGEKRTPHTLNSTAIATSRALVAILENCQNEDGTVTVPEALRKFMGGKERILVNK